MGTDAYTVTEISHRLISHLPKLPPNIAVIMARYSPGESVELIQRLNQYTDESDGSGGWVSQSTECACIGTTEMLIGIY